jgi:hypothetical protein
VTGPQIGMGMDSDDIVHCAVLSQTNIAVQVMHLTADHELPASTVMDEVTQDGSIVMLHMNLHGRVVQLEEDDG